MNPSKRPLSILWFAGLSLLSIAAGLAYSWLSWDDAVALAAVDGFGPEAVIAMMTLSCGLELLLLWLIAWRRNNVAKWAWMILSVLALIAVLTDYRTLFAEERFMIALSSVQFVLPVLALCLLFRRDARRWFAGQTEVDPNVFD